MIKETIQWRGHHGRNMTKTLYFDLDRFEISHDMELEVLEERFKKFQEEVIGDNPDATRMMTPPEVREMLDIVKIIIRHAYGVRSADGTRFSKTDPDIWAEFVDTGAFNAFVWYLFDDADRANAFMNGIWPPELLEEPVKAVPDIHAVPDMPNTQMETHMAASQGDLVAPDEDIPSITSAKPAEFQLKDQLRDYTDQEILGMSTGEFDAVMDKFRSGNNVPSRLLVLGFARAKEGGPTD